MCHAMANARSLYVFVHSRRSPGSSFYRWFELTLLRHPRTSCTRRAYQSSPHPVRLSSFLSKCPIVSLRRWRHKYQIGRLHRHRPAAIVDLNGVALPVKRDARTKAIIEIGACHEAGEHHALPHE